MAVIAHRMVTRGESLADAVVGQIANVASPQDVFHKDRIYVMLLGIDYDYDTKDQPFSKHSRSDTIMVAGLDFASKSTRLISVLRDTDATINGHETKINAAYAQGGTKLADSTIGEFLGMPQLPDGTHFDRYVVVRVNALKDFINAIGGIDVPVTQAMDYDDSWGHLHIHFKPGMVHMDGEQAQGYVRFRHDACSDPCRTKRQQQVIRITVAKLSHEKLNDIAHVAQLIDVLRRDVDTNMSLDELKSLAWSFKDAQPGQLAKAATIGYVGTRQTADGETVIPDDQQKAELVADLLGPYAVETAPPASAVAAVAPAKVHVVVQNGSGVPGAATSLAGTLKSRGYIVDAIGDADSFGYDTTEIRAMAMEAGARVRQDIGIAGAALAKPAANVKARADEVDVIVGKDYAVRAKP